MHHLLRYRNWKLRKRAEMEQNEEEMKNLEELVQLKVQFKS